MPGIGLTTLSVTFTPTDTTDYNTAIATVQLTVDQAPGITSASSVIFTPNVANSFTVTATGYPAPTFSETGTLPSGVTLNATTGVLSGTPTVTGGFPITITASNGVGPDATQSFTLAVAGVSSTVTTAASGTVQWTQTIGTGTNRILLVGVSFRTDSTGSDSGGQGNSGNTYVTGVKLGTTSLTCLGAINDNASGTCGSGATGTYIYMRSEVWYLLNPTAGTGNVTVTTNNATIIEGSSAWYAGVGSVALGGAAASKQFDISDAPMVLPVQKK